MLGFVAFCIIAILLFAYSPSLVLWVAVAFVLIPFFGGLIFGGRTPIDDERPPYKSPYPRGNRHINPDTGREWWDK